MFNTATNNFGSGLLSNNQATAFNFNNNNLNNINNNNSNNVFGTNTNNSFSNNISNNVNNDAVELIKIQSKYNEMYSDQINGQFIFPIYSKMDYFSTKLNNQNIDEYNDLLTIVDKSNPNNLLYKSNLIIGNDDLTNRINFLKNQLSNMKQYIEDQKKNKIEQYINQLKSTKSKEINIVNENNKKVFNLILNLMKKKSDLAVMLNARTVDYTHKKELEDKLEVIKGTLKLVENNITNYSQNNTKECNNNTIIDIIRPENDSIFNYLSDLKSGINNLVERYNNIVKFDN